MSTTNLARLVLDHQIRFKPHADREKRYYQEFSTLVDCIQNAALARTSKGKRHSHQRRLSEDTLSRVAKRLLTQVAEIQAADTFETIFEIVTDCAVSGFGELAIYDTADRIGTWLDVEPQNVYLHSGTRTGARKLGIRVTREYLTKDDLPLELREMEAGDIENFLCLYKGSFQSGQDKPEISVCFPDLMTHYPSSCCN